MAQGNYSKVTVCVRIELFNKRVTNVQCTTLQCNTLLKFKTAYVIDSPLGNVRAFGFCYILWKETIVGQYAFFLFPSSCAYIRTLAAAVNLSSYQICMYSHK